MPDYISAIVFVGGISVFIASLLYAREYLRFRQDLRKMRALQRRALDASRLPSEEAQREFATVLEEFRKLQERPMPEPSKERH